jgi:hypothetical protein
MPGANLDSWARHIVGNWQTNGVWSWRTGFPYNIGASTSDLNTSDSGVRPDIQSDPTQIDQTRKLWYDPTQYVRVTCDIPDRQDRCHIGNAGYNVYDSYGQGNLDFSLYKNIPMTESTRLQFRAEFFNAFNTPYFGAPGGISYSAQGVLTPDGSRNGEIRSIRVPMRIVQFGLKLFF